jgi:thioredoxin-like negative regulator of GroEL
MSAKRVLTLFSSPTCSLCVPVKEVLQEAVAASGDALELRVVDISARENIAAFRLYKHDIPVVLLDGTEVARHRLSREQLQSCLEKRV